MQIKRPALRYHGGKWKLAPWIISHFPAHRIYVEPYAGGASVLMRKPRSYAEVYNDKWGIVVNVFRVLRDPEMAARLREQLILTPFARDEFLVCGDAEIVNITDPVEMARRTILRSFAGYASASTSPRYTTGFRARNSGESPANDWANYPDHIAAFTERLRGVVIENKNAIEVILQHDTPQTLFYVDPPYPHSTRQMKRGNTAYECEMTDEQHRELAGVLHSVNGMVIISGYPCELYDADLYKDWTRIECKALADGALERTEVLWLSENAVQKTLL